MQRDAQVHENTYMAYTHALMELGAMATNSMNYIDGIQVDMRGTMIRR